MKKISVCIVVFLSVVIFSACTITSNQESNFENQTISSAKINTEDSADTTQEIVSKPQAQQSYDIDMDDFTFSETELVVQAGEEVIINLTNVEGYHDLVIDELDVHSEHLKVGETEVLSFTVTEDHIGQTYEFYCSVGNHRQQGMVGTIQIIK